MGGSRCQIIIMEGNIGYGMVENFGKENPEINVIFLGAAIQASCAATLHVSLFFANDYEKVSREYTQPIIDIHKEIATRLCQPVTTIKQGQRAINILTRKLEDATRHLIGIFTE